MWIPLWLLSLPCLYGLLLALCEIINLRAVNSYCLTASCLHPHTDETEKNQPKNGTRRRFLSLLIPLTNLVSINSFPLSLYLSLSSACNPVTPVPAFDPALKAAVTSIIKQLFSISQYHDVDVFFIWRSCWPSLLLSLTIAIPLSFSLSMSLWRCSTQLTPWLGQIWFFWSGRDLN